MYLELDYSTEFSSEFIIDNLDYDYIDACTNTYEVQE